MKILAVNWLKNGKSSRLDHIDNEWIKATKTIMLDIYHKQFNLIYRTLGIIKPIYKGKGDNNAPDNYRPVTILSCMGELFTRIRKNQ